MESEKEAMTPPTGAMTNGLLLPYQLVPPLLETSKPVGGVMVTIPVRFKPETVTVCVVDGAADVCEKLFNTPEKYISGETKVMLLR